MKDLSNSSYWIFYDFATWANLGLPCYFKKKGNYRNVDENIGEFQHL